MQKITIFLFLNLITALSLPAQKSGKAVGGSEGENLRQVLALPDGGFLLAGGTASNNGDVKGGDKTSLNGDIWLLRTDAAGEILWQQRYGGAGRETAVGIALAPGGGYFLAGAVDSLNGDVQAARGQKDIWLARLNETGVLLWQRTLGGSAGERAAGVSALPGGGCIVYGETTSSDGDVQELRGSADIWLVRLDADGKTLWSRTIGGKATDQIFTVKPAPGGGFLVVGSTTSSEGDILNNRGASDALLAHVDDNGKLLWLETYGGSADDEAANLLPASDGGYYLCGHTESADGDAGFNYGLVDAWLFKTGADGKFQWGRTYGGLSHDLAVEIVQASDTALLLIGNTYDLDKELTGVKGKAFDVMLLKVGAQNGALQKAYIYGGSGNDFARSVAFNAGSGDLVLTGITDSGDGDIAAGSKKGKKDGLFLKLKTKDLLLARPEDKMLVRSFPNPALNHVYFDRPLTGWLLSAAGVPLVELSNADHADLSGLQAGVYSIRVAETGQMLRVVKIDSAPVKEK
jgi:hypothetical protein